MNSHIVEKTMHSIKNIDRLTDLAAIDVYNTTHDTINKYEIMKEHATEEYTNESFYQESVLAGVLIGAGVLGVAISAFFIIKKIIDSKDSADSSVKSSDGKMVAAQVDLSDPKSTEKYLTDLKARLEKLTETKTIKVTKRINKDEFEAAEKQINDWSEKLQEMIDNKHEAAEIEKIIDGINISSIDVSKIFVNGESDASVADFAEALGLRSISSFASLLSSLKKKIDDVEKMVNNKKDKEAENAVQISQEHLTKLKNQNNAAAKLIATLKAQSTETLSETDKAVLGAINAETEAKNKDEEAKPAAGTGSDTPQNANPQAQSSETAAPVAQNSGQSIPPSSTPENIDFQASGFNGGKPAEPAPVANLQAAATGSETPTPVSGNQPIESNLGTNFLNAGNGQKQQQLNADLTQQFGSNPNKEAENKQKWINAANANNAATEAEKQETNPAPQQPTPSPQPQPQKSETETEENKNLEDDKINNLSDTIYGNQSPEKKAAIASMLTDLRNGEAETIKALDMFKEVLNDNISKGKKDIKAAQDDMTDRVTSYELIADEFGINADYLKSYDATIPTEVKSENENKEKSPAPTDQNTDENAQETTPEQSSENQQQTQPQQDVNQNSNGINIKDMDNIIRQASYDGISKDISESICKNVIDDISSNTAFNVANRVKDEAVKLRTDQKLYFTDAAKRILRVYANAIADIEPQTDAVKKYAEEVKQASEMDLSLIEPPVVSGGNLEPPKEYVNKVATLIKQIPGAIPNKAKELAESEYGNLKNSMVDDIAKQLDEPEATNFRNAYASIINGSATGNIDENQLSQFGDAAAAANTNNSANPQDQSESVTSPQESINAINEDITRAIDNARLSDTAKQDLFKISGENIINSIVQSIEQLGGKQAQPEQVCSMVNGTLSNRVYKLIHDAIMQDRKFLQRPVFNTMSKYGEAVTTLCSQVRDICAKMLVSYYNIPVNMVDQIVVPFESYKNNKNSVMYKWFREYDIDVIRDKKIQMIMELQQQEEQKSE